MDAVPLRLLVDMIVQRAYKDLADMTETVAPARQRQQELMRYLHEARQRFMRLLVILRWLSKSGQADNVATLVQATHMKHLTVLETANALHGHVESMAMATLPSYDVPHAVDVLGSGEYPRMPRNIELLLPEPPLLKSDVDRALSWLHMQIRGRLADEPAPRGLSAVTIGKGRLTLTCGGLYSMAFTIDNNSATSPWRLLTVDVFVRDEWRLDAHAAPASCERLVTSPHIERLRRLLKGILDTTRDQPLSRCCAAIHTFCLSLQLNTMAAQAEALQRTKWGSSVVVDASSSPSSLKLSFWPEFKRLVSRVESYDELDGNQSSSPPSSSSSSSSSSSWLALVKAAAGAAPPPGSTQPASQSSSRGGGVEGWASATLEIVSPLRPQTPTTGSKQARGHHANHNHANRTSDDSGDNSGGVDEGANNEAMPPVYDSFDFYIDVKPTPVVGMDGSDYDACMGRSPNMQALLTCVQRRLSHHLLASIREQLAASALVASCAAMVSFGPAPQDPTTPTAATTTTATTTAAAAATQPLSLWRMGTRSEGRSGGVMDTRWHDVADDDGGAGNNDDDVADDAMCVNVTFPIRVEATAASAAAAAMKSGDAEDSGPSLGTTSSPSSPDVTALETLTPTEERLSLRVCPDSGRLFLTTCLQATDLHAVEQAINFDPLQAPSCMHAAMRTCVLDAVIRRIASSSFATEVKMTSLGGLSHVLDADTLAFSRCFIFLDYPGHALLLSVSASLSMRVRMLACHIEAPYEVAASFPGHTATSPHMSSSSSVATAMLATNAKTNSARAGSTSSPASGGGGMTPSSSTSLGLSAPSRGNTPAQTPTSAGATHSSLAPSSTTAPAPAVLRVYDSARAVVASALRMSTCEMRQAEGRRWDRICQAAEMEGALRVDTVMDILVDKHQHQHQHQQQQQGLADARFNWSELEQRRLQRQLAVTRFAMLLSCVSRQLRSDSLRHSPLISLSDAQSWSLLETGVTFRIFNLATSPLVPLKSAHLHCAASGICRWQIAMDTSRLPSWLHQRQTVADNDSLALKGRFDWAAGTFTATSLTPAGCLDALQRPWYSHMKFLQTVCMLRDESLPHHKLLSLHSFGADGLEIGVHWKPNADKVVPTSSSTAAAAGATAGAGAGGGGGGDTNVNSSSAVLGDALTTTTSVAIDAATAAASATSGHDGVLGNITTAGLPTSGSAVSPAPPSPPAEEEPQLLVLMRFVWQHSRQEFDVSHRCPRAVGPDVELTLDRVRALFTFLLNKRKHGLSILLFKLASIQPTLRLMFTGPRFGLKVFPRTFSRVFVSYRQSFVGEFKFCSNGAVLVRDIFQTAFRTEPAVQYLASPMHPMPRLQPFIAHLAQRLMQRRKGFIAIHGNVVMADVRARQHVLPLRDGDECDALTRYLSIVGVCECLARLCNQLSGATVTQQPTRENPLLPLQMYVPPAKLTLVIENFSRLVASWSFDEGSPSYTSDMLMVLQDIIDKKVAAPPFPEAAASLFLKLLLLPMKQVTDVLSVCRYMDAGIDLCVTPPAGIVFATDGDTDCFAIARSPAPPGQARWFGVVFLIRGPSNEHHVVPLQLSVTQDRMSLWPPNKHKTHPRRLLAFKQAAAFIQANAEKWRTVTMLFALCEHLYSNHDDLSLFPTIAQLQQLPSK
ncbi:hypothetical protein PTSG_12212 [Salpingoeca rosetta]|uniref:Mediator of RNA polymerase II transcription subunit 14 n=1 Tax=Salpingoeca rosetta (strain ATCC 50818 / BSB-021) TaxID=946362 RepID=F2U9P0_SALR5|nr:uncharacterized protein PTSG_12212 [Salpingoeca rosetta]EGD73067.1 hypothetical protein PTSG_12212 [Salpingoeca rosetta]|eukprot:XP_004994098.1 hypothetical protein PTSG_12212 [Salpingoeca rosetta]